MDIVSRGIAGPTPLLTTNEKQNLRKAIREPRPNYWNEMQATRWTDEELKARFEWYVRHGETLNLLFALRGIDGKRLSTMLLFQTGEPLSLMLSLVRAADQPLRRAVPDQVLSRYSNLQRVHQFAGSGNCTPSTTRTPRYTSCFRISATSSCSYCDPREPRACSGPCRTWLCTAVRSASNG